MDYPVSVFIYYFFISSKIFRLLQKHGGFLNTVTLKGLCACIAVLTKLG